MAANDSSDLNPIEFASFWQYFTIATVISPGAIPVNGIRGFERETGWDKKKGKGVSGATLSQVSAAPAEGQIDLQLWLPEHFVAWATFRQLLRYTPGKVKGSTAADAVDIYHPSLAGVEISRVVTHKVSPERHMGGGMYLVTIDFIEWKTPVQFEPQTTSSSKAGSQKNTPGDAPNPVIVALQKEIKIEQDKNATPTFDQRQELRR